MGKIFENIVIASDDSPFSVIKDVTKYEKFAIQINYGTGTGSTVDLQGSLDYNPDTEEGTFIEIPNTSQALANAGGSHIYNVIDAIYPFIKLEFTGDAADVEVRFVGDAQPRRG